MTRIKDSTRLLDNYFGSLGEKQVNGQVTRLRKLSSETYKNLRKDGCYDGMMWNQFYIVDNDDVWRVYISNDIWKFEQSSSRAMENWIHDVVHALAEDYFEETLATDFVISLLGKEYDVWVETDGDYALDFDIRELDDED